MRSVPAVIFLCSLLVPSLSRAEERGCDQVAGEGELRAEAHRARVWRFGWTGANAALTVGSFVAVPFVPAEDRPDWVIGGIGSAVTTAVTFAMPLRVESAEAELDELPASVRSRRIGKLLRESAADERARVTWPWHALNVGVSLVPGAIIAFGYEHHASGIVTSVVAIALGEAQLLTQPMGLATRCEGSAWRLVPRLQLVGSGERTTGGVLTLMGVF